MSHQDETMDMTWDRIQLCPSLGDSTKVDSATAAVVFCCYWLSSSSSLSSSYVERAVTMLGSKEDVVVLVLPKSAMRETRRTFYRSVSAS
jgi:hypothetical protein